MDVIYQFISLLEDKTLAIFLTTLAAIYALFLRNLFPKIKLLVLHTVLIASATFSFDLLAFSTVFDPSTKISSIIFNREELIAYFLILLLSFIALLVLLPLPFIFLYDLKNQNFLERWKSLKSFPTWILFESQKEKFINYKIHTLINLGSTAKAENYVTKLLEENSKLCKKNRSLVKTPFLLLLEIEKAYLSGDIEKQIEVSAQAVNAITEKTPALFQHQFYLNKAIAYFYEHDYINADNSFLQALKFIEEKKIKDRNLIFLFYKDYLRNKVCLNSNISEIKNILCEVKKYIRKNNSEDWMHYFDIELTILQQANAPLQDVKKNIEASLQKVEELKLKEYEKFIYTVKIARIITSYHSNPEYCIYMLSGKSHCLKKISFPERHYIFKDLDYLFKELRGPILVYVKDLINETISYFSKTAEYEINSFIKKLPDEAVIYRIDFLKELSSLTKFIFPIPDFHKIKQYLTSAINLCDENRLSFNAMSLRLCIADEALAPYNLENLIKSKYEKEIKEVIEIVSSFATNLKTCSEEAEFDFRLAYYCLFIRDYEKHKFFFERYLKTNFPKEYFASWCKIYIETCALTYSILTLLEILEEVSNTPALQTEMTDDTKTFLQSFSTSNGFDLSLIMGFFIGRNFIIKHCIITHDSKNNVSTEHCWLLLPDIGLEIDPLYKNFKNDEYRDCIFFNQNHHPLQTKESFTSKSVENIVTREISYNSISYNDAFKASFYELKSVINKKIDEKAETLEVVPQYL